MRKLFLILFLAMLPLQWSAAAVASLCLPDGQAMGSSQAHAHAGAPTDAAGHAHRHASDAASDLAGHHQGAHDAGQDGKVQHTDHGGCCHVPVSTLPTPLRIARMQPAPGDLVARLTVLAVSHASESPFRPPRLALA